MFDSIVISARFSIQQDFHSSHFFSHPHLKPTVHAGLHQKNFDSAENIGLCVSCSTIQTTAVGAITTDGMRQNIYFTPSEASGISIPSCIVALPQSFQSQVRRETFGIWVSYNNTLKPLGSRSRCAQQFYHRVFRVRLDGNPMGIRWESDGNSMGSRFHPITL